MEPLQNLIHQSVAGIKDVDPDDADGGAAQERRREDERPGAIPTTKWLVEEQRDQQPEDQRSANRARREDERVLEHLSEGVVGKEILVVIQPLPGLGRGKHVPADQAEIAAIDQRPEGEEAEKDHVRGNEEQEEGGLRSPDPADHAGPLYCWSHDFGSR